MPATAPTPRQLSPIKPPARCPACNSTKVAPKGTRAKKLETIRLFRCRARGRTFAPGPRALRNKTYPLNEILEAFTIYNRGNSLEDTSRRLSSRHGHAVNPATISRWLAAHSGLTTYRRLRAKGLGSSSRHRSSAPSSFTTARSMNSPITAPSLPSCAMGLWTTVAAATRASLRSPISWTG